MAFDTSYLKKHGNQYLVIVKVPARLREVIGKAHLKHPLRTDSLAVANREKGEIVTALKRRIRDAEAQQRRKASLPADPLAEEAFEWRQALVDQPEDAVYALDVRYEELTRREGAARADDFAAIATGTATPVSWMVDRWLAERPMKPRQKIDYRRAVMKFEAWLLTHKLSNAIEAITRKLAGRYVSEAFVAVGKHWRTTNKDISCLSAYWKWLKIKDHVPENVWMGQSLPEEEPSSENRKREYTDAEIKKLLGAPTSVLLSDAMRMAALSGMRVEEIAKLRIKHISGGCMRVDDAKTKAGNRLVPIHPALASIVARRSKGKSETDYLFDELPTPRKDSPIERSQRISKDFTGFRRDLGIDDQPEGARQSRVDFHSFRRWFITKAEQAGQPPHIIASVVGHMRQGMTLGVYSGGPSMEQLVACVRAVKLPTKKQEEGKTNG